jgi:hypothetical protein
MTMKEYITRGLDDDADWICICGNETGHSGFLACDSAGNEMRPSADSDWNDLYVCGKCGRIIDQNTLEVVGRNPNPVLL